MMWCLQVSKPTSHGMGPQRSKYAAVQRGHDAVKESCLRLYVKGSLIDRTGMLLNSKNIMILLCSKCVIQTAVGQMCYDCWHLGSITL